MSDTVLIAIIFAVTMIIVVLILRGTLTKVGIKANTDGVEADLEANSPPSSHVNIEGNKIAGQDQSLKVSRGNTNIKDNELKGKGQKIEVR